MPAAKTLSLKNDPNRMDDAGDIAQDRQQDVEPEVTADADLEEYTEWWQ